MKHVCMCVPFRRNGAHLTDAFKTEVNLFQKVPCIMDNDFKLSESIAILIKVRAVLLKKLSEIIKIQQIQVLEEEDELHSGHTLSIGIEGTSG